VNVTETVQKALTAKLPKLVATKATRRILLLERNPWTLSEQDIHADVDKLRSAFPSLSSVDVWSEFGEDFLAGFGLGQRRYRREHIGLGASVQKAFVTPCSRRREQNKTCSQKSPTVMVPGQTQICSTPGLTGGNPTRRSTTAQTARRPTATIPSASRVVRMALYHWTPIVVLPA